MYSFRVAACHGQSLRAREPGFFDGGGLHFGELLLSEMAIGWVRGDAGGGLGGILIRWDLLGGMGKAIWVEDGIVFGRFHSDTSG